MSITRETGTVCGHVFMRFPQDIGFTEVDNNFLFYTMRRFLDDFKNSYCLEMKCRNPILVWFMNITYVLFAVTVECKI